MMRSTCRKCHGKGTFNRNPCKQCKGEGQYRQRQQVVVPVPAGIEDGQTVRMPVGRKEVFITFRVAKSDYFRRQGADVHCDAKISLAQAALGGTIRVRGIHEDLNVAIPPGTSGRTWPGLPHTNSVYSYRYQFAHSDATDRKRHSKSLWLRLW